MSLDNVSVRRVNQIPRPVTDSEAAGLLMLVGPGAKDIVPLRRWTQAAGALYGVGISSLRSSSRRFT